MKKHTLETESHWSKFESNKKSIESVSICLYGYAVLKPKVKLDNGLFMHI